MLVLRAEWTPSPPASYPLFAPFDFVEIIKTSLNSLNPQALHSDVNRRSDGSLYGRGKSPRSKEGERVSTQNAADMVIAVDSEHMTVDLKLLGATDHRLIAVPRGVLIFLKNSDASPKG